MSAAQGPPGRGGRVASADGAELAFRVLGEGETAVVLVHCWAGDSELWRETVPPLAERYRVVVPELAGHGSSERRRREWTVQAFGQDVGAVVEATVPTPGPLILVGHSMGALVILEAARLLRDRVLGLVAVDALHSLDWKGDARWTEDMIRSLRRDFGRSCRAYVRQLLPRNVRPKVATRLGAKLASADRDSAVASLLAAQRYAGVVETLRGLGRPLRAVNGSLFPTDVERNRKLYPRYEAVVLRGVGHFPMVEAPARFTAALERVLEELASTCRRA